MGACNRPTTYMYNFFEKNFFFGKNETGTRAKNQRESFFFLKGFEMKQQENCLLQKILREGSIKKGVKSICGKTAVDGNCKLMRCNVMIVYVMINR